MVNKSKYTIAGNGKTEIGGNVCSSAQEWKLDLARATLDQAIRSDPKAYGVTAEKITEAAVGDAIDILGGLLAAVPPVMDARLASSPTA